MTRFFPVKGAKGKQKDASPSQLSRSGAKRCGCDEFGWFEVGFEDPATQEIVPVEDGDDSDVFFVVCRVEGDAKR